MYPKIRFPFNFIFLIPSPIENIPSNAMFIRGKNNVKMGILKYTNIFPGKNTTPSSIVNNKVIDNKLLLILSNIFHFERELICSL